MSDFGCDEPVCSSTTGAISLIVRPKGVSAGAFGDRNVFSQGSAQARRALHAGEFLGEIEYEDFIAAGDPQFAWHLPADECSVVYVLTNSSVVVCVSKQLKFCLVSACS